MDEKEIRMRYKAAYNKISEYFESLEDEDDLGKQLFNDLWIDDVMNELDENIIYFQQKDVAAYYLYLLEEELDFEYVLSLFDIYFRSSRFLMDIFDENREEE